MRKTEKEHTIYCGEIQLILFFDVFELFLINTLLENRRRQITLSLEDEECVNI